MRLTLYSTAVSLFGIAAHAATVQLQNANPQIQDLNSFDDSTMAQKSSSSHRSGEFNESMNGNQGGQVTMKHKAAAVVDKLREGVRAL